jgi:REP element-mobilizing transposase RayT
MARPVRIEYPGAVYHVICRGNDRRAVFRDDQDRKTYLEKLSLYCGQKSVDLLSYCLLTNHIHLLLETPEGNLSKMMQPFQTSYTVYFNRRHRRSGHVFEQRYKALLVDKDNYLLEVSRYIHLNPVAAKIVGRPQDYRWSSYGAYLKGKGIAGLKAETVLGYFVGGRRKQLAQYREFVEGEKERWAEPEVLKQVFIGDEEFMEWARQKAGKISVAQGHYPLKRIVAAVSNVSGVGAEQIKRPQQNNEVVKQSRELVSYVSRRYSDVGLGELARYLQVKELSTPCHAVTRAEDRLKTDQEFRRQLERVLKKLAG